MKPQFYLLYNNSEINYYMEIFVKLNVARYKIKLTEYRHSLTGHTFKLQPICFEHTTSKDSSELRRLQGTSLNIHRAIDSKFTVLMPHISYYRELLVWKLLLPHEFSLMLGLCIHGFFRRRHAFQLNQDMSIDTLCLFWWRFERNNL